jgi:DNA-binding transcriptional LysR family regulator
MAAMTLPLDDDESEAPRRRAHAEGRRMQQVLDEALREYLQRHESITWQGLMAEPPLFDVAREEIDAAIEASDREWAGEGDE